MPIHHYKSELLEKAQIEKSPDGSITAYLIASEGANSEKLSELKTHLSKNGYQFAPTLFEEKQPSLKVVGFDKEKDFLFSLKAFDGSLKQTQSETLESDTPNRKEEVKRAALKIAGGSYLVGDGFYYWYGRVKDSAKKLAQGATKAASGSGGGFRISNDIAASFAYMAGSLGGFVFGKDPAAANLKHLQRGLISELGVELPEESALGHFEKQQKARSGFQKAFDHLSRFPAEILNLCIAAAGTFVMLAGLEDYRDKKEELNKLSKLDTAHPMALNKDEFDAKMKSAKFDRNLEAVTGLISLGVGVGGSIIKEDKTVNNLTPQEQANRGIFQKMWDKVRSSPQKMVGYGLMGSTATHLLLSVNSFMKTPKEIEGWRDKLNVDQNIKTKNLINADHKDSLVNNWEQYNFSDKKDAQHAAGTLGELVGSKRAFLFRLLFVVSNVISEVLISISSKGHGAGISTEDNKTSNSMIDMAAEVIAKYEGTEQENILQKTADYLAKPGVLGMKRDEAEQTLREAISEMHDNPWSIAVKAKATIDAAAPKLVADKSTDLVQENTAETKGKDWANNIDKKAETEKLATRVNENSSFSLGLSGQ